MVRITPAYAGKSYFHEHSPHKNQDHPRLCGEKLLIQRVLLCFPGSPPPMRGKGNTGDTYTRQFGITPAYAGKSSKKLDLSNCR